MINNDSKSCITLPNQVQNSKRVVALRVFRIQFWFLEVLSYVCGYSSAESIAVSLRARNINLRNYSSSYIKLRTNVLL
jgi:hypothetical protein